MANVVKVSTFFHVALQSSCSILLDFQQLSAHVSRCTYSLPWVDIEHPRVCNSQRYERDSACRVSRLECIALGWQDGKQRIFVLVLTCPYSSKVFYWRWMVLAFFIILFGYFPIIIISLFISVSKNFFDVIFKTDVRYQLLRKF